MTRADARSTAAPQLRGSGRRHGRPHPGGRGGRGGRDGGSRRPRGASGLLTALIVAVVLFLSLMAMPGLFGYGTLVVLSGSMEETAPVGSLVLARPLDTRDVVVGDVILVRREGATVTAATPVLHRVISLTHREGGMVVTTKGDSNAAPDPTPYTLHGKTMTPVFAVPHLGRGYTFVHSPLGWTLLVALPATMLLWVELRTIWFPARRSPAHRSRGSRFPAHRRASHRSASQRSAAHRPAWSWFSARPHSGPTIPNDHASAPA